MLGSLGKEGSSLGRLPIEACPRVHGAKMRNRLKALRSTRKWSQTELAEKLGVSRQSVSSLETGKYDPSLPLAFDIADLFGMKIEDIFEKSNDNHKS